MQVQPSEVAGIQLVPYSDPAFRATLTGLSGDVDLSIVEPILPYTAIVKNTGPLRTLAVCTRYEIEQSDGHNQVISGRLESLNNPQYALSPGGAMLVTPSAMAGSAISSGRELRPEPIYKMLRQWLPILERAVRVTLFVDAVIFEDGTYSGPDKSKYILDVQESSRARKSFRAAMRQIKDEDLRRWLLAQRSDTYPGSPAAPDFCANEWDNLARSLAVDLEHLGAQYVRRVLDALADTPALTLTRRK